MNVRTSHAKRPFLKNLSSFLFHFFTKYDPTRLRNCEDVSGQSSTLVVYFTFWEKIKRPREREIVRMSHAKQPFFKKTIQNIYHFSKK